MGYHIAVTDLREGGSLEELARLPEQGVTSYKLFMAYKGALMVDDETLFRTMEVAAETGRARDGARRERRRDRRPREAGARGGEHGAALPRADASARDSRARRRTARSSSRGSPGAPLYVVHVSCKEAVEPIARAREQGWDVWGETCTQYFFIDYTYLERPDFEGAKYVYTPPPRADREPGGPLARGALGHPLRDLDRPLRVPLGRPEDARQGRLLEDPERRARASRTGCT